MCGIAGIYNSRSGRPAAPSELRAMGGCLAHRGPDDEGYYEEGPLGLAHKRLTILDTSRRGRQPMFTDLRLYQVEGEGMLSRLNGMGSSRRIG